jgi:hypothetical protein
MHFLSLYNKTVTKLCEIAVTPSVDISQHSVAARSVNLIIKVSLSSPVIVFKEDSNVEGLLENFILYFRNSGRYFGHTVKRV